MEYEEIMQALRNADAAGDTEAAARFAQMARDARPTPSKYPEGTQILAEVSGGQVYELPNGQRGFSGDGYSTTDPDKIAEMLQGVPPQATSQLGFMEDVVQQFPVAARTAAALQGVPFAGEYLDEAIGATFGEPAKTATRMSQEAMAQTRPIETTALQLGTGIASSAPAAVLAAPYVAGMLPASMAGKVATGVALGTAGSALEGGISGYGAGNDGNRMAEAARRGMFGGTIGGIMGAVVPFAGAAVRRGVEAYKAAPTRQAARQAGIDQSSARMLSNAVNADQLVSQQNISRAGPAAMVADAGPNTRQLLDLAIQGSGPGATAARLAVQNRAGQAGRQLVDALDNTLGQPQGINAIQRDLMQSTAAARGQAYDAAYSASIDYTSEAGQNLGKLVSRIPRGIIRDAEALMRAEGRSSPQLRTVLGDSGETVFENLPDVRQIDYITRALRDEASKLERHGGGDIARVYKGLSREIRTLLGSDDLVPEYTAARNLAADVISQREAVQLGRDMLLSRTTREDFADELAGMGADQLTRARQGVRGYIDDIMANAKRALTDDNMDAREALRPLTEMTTRAGKEKLEMLLGQQAAGALNESMDEIYSSLALRARVADNSKTFIRQEFSRLRDDLSQPGAMELLTDQASPIAAGKKAVGALLGSDPMAATLREQSVMSNLADVLTSSADPAAAVRGFSQFGPTLDAARLAGINAGQEVSGVVAGAIPAISGISGQSGPSKVRARALELSQAGISNPARIAEILRREGLTQ